MNSTLNQFLKVSRACMERYSKDTHMRVGYMLTTHEAVIEMEKLIDRNLPEQAFLKELEELQAALKQENQ